MEKNNFGKILVGGFLILLGAGFFLNQYFDINFGQIVGTFWPVTILICGIYIIARAKSQLFLGAGIFLIGLATLVDQLFDLPFQVWSFWPLILVFIGVRILFGKNMDAKGPNGALSESNTFESTAIFWGDSRRIKSDNFRFGKVTVMFGGSELDLRDIKTTDEAASIDIVVMFGGVDIKVNENTLIISDGIGIFGGFSEKTIKPEKPTGTIRIKGVAMFGGVNVKNV